MPEQRAHRRVEARHVGVVAAQPSVERAPEGVDRADAVRERGAQIAARRDGGLVRDGHVAGGARLDQRVERAPESRWRHVERLIV
jgi:hypothetical protein